MKIHHAYLAISILSLSLIATNVPNPDETEDLRVRLLARYQNPDFWRSMAAPPTIAAPPRLNPPAQVSDVIIPSPSPANEPRAPATQSGLNLNPNLVPQRRAVRPASTFQKRLSLLMANLPRHPAGSTGLNSGDVPIALGPSTSRDQQPSTSNQAPQGPGDGAFLRHLKSVLASQRAAAKERNQVSSAMAAAPAPEISSAPPIQQVPIPPTALGQPEISAANTVADTLTLENHQPASAAQPDGALINNPLGVSVPKKLRSPGLPQRKIESPKLPYAHDPELDTEGSLDDVVEALKALAGSSNPEVEPSPKRKRVSPPPKRAKPVDDLKPKPRGRPRKVLPDSETGPPRAKLRTSRTSRASLPVEAKPPAVEIDLESYRSPQRSRKQSRRTISSNPVRIGGLSPNLDRPRAMGSQSDLDAIIKQFQDSQNVKDKQDRSDNDVAMAEEAKQFRDSQNVKDTRDRSDDDVAMAEEAKPQSPAEITHDSSDEDLPSAVFGVHMADANMKEASPLDEDDEPPIVTAPSNMATIASDGIPVVAQPEEEFPSPASVGSTIRYVDESQPPTQQLSAMHEPPAVPTAGTLNVWRAIYKNLSRKN